MRRILVILGLLAALLPALPASSRACNNETALRTGLTVRVRSVVNLRSAPGLNARDIGDLRTDDLVTIVGGPTCVSAITWWQVSGVKPGWVAESTQSAVYLEAAPVSPAELRSPLDGLTVSFVETASAARPADQCPPLSGNVSVNFAGVADPFASGGEAAFFVDGGFGAPLPSLCVPSSRGTEAAVAGPDGTTAAAAILPVDGAADFVRATLPDTALLQPGMWVLSLPDFALNVRVTGPFAPLVDARSQGSTTQVLLAGFVPGEQIAVVAADVSDSAASAFRVVTLRADTAGAAGANIDGLGLPVIAAVSESGLIALPPSIQGLDLPSSDSRTDVYDQLVIALWGFEVLGLPSPTPIPPTSTPEPPTPTPEATFTPTPEVTATPSAVGTPDALPTGIINLGTPTPAEAAPTPTPEVCTYTVRRGDSLFRIAVANQLTTAQLLAANPQITNPQLIFAGNILNIPGCGQGLQ